MIRKKIMQAERKENLVDQSKAGLPNIKMNTHTHTEFIFEIHRMREVGLRKLR